MEKQKIVTINDLVLYVSAFIICSSVIIFLLIYVNNWYVNNGDYNVLDVEQPMTIVEFNEDEQMYLPALNREYTPGELVTYNIKGIKNLGYIGYKGVLIYEQYCFARESDLFDEILNEQKYPTVNADGQTEIQSNFPSGPVDTNISVVVHETDWAVSYCRIQTTVNYLLPDGGFKTEPFITDIFVVYEPENQG